MLSPEKELGDIEVMEELGADFFELNGHSFLAAVDRVSSFPFVQEMNPKGTADVCLQLRKWFQEWGWPRIIRTDGGSQFRDSFNTWCKSMHIEHDGSSAYFPQSNGLAEAAVACCKMLIKKCVDAKEDVPMAIQEYRNAEMGNAPAPSEIFFKRQLRGS
jgi:hypothetical protein